ncbi:MAG: DMT family transporter [Phycisphaerae bacterium]
MSTLQTPPFPFAGEAAALSAALIWTVTAIFGDIAVRRVGSLSVNILRLAMASAAFCVYGLLVHGQAVPMNLSWHNWSWLFLSGLMGFAVGDLCLFKAFGIIGPRLAMLMMSLAPLIAAVISWIALGQRMLLMGWIGMAVTLAGVVWVVMERRTDANGVHRPHPAKGIIIGAIAPAGQAVGIVMTKYGMGDPACDGAAATQVRVLAGTAGFLAIMLFTRWHRPTLAALRDGRAMLMIALNTLIGTCLGVTAQLLSLRYILVGVTSTLSAIIPVTILPLAILVNKERVSARAVIGAFVTVIGVAMLCLWGEPPR